MEADGGESASKPREVREESEARPGPIRRPKLYLRRVREDFLEKNRARKSVRARRLRVAVTTNNVPLVRRLLEEGSDANEADEHARGLLHLAACQGYADVVRLLVAHGADPNRKDGLGNTPLHLAACTHHVPVVLELLNAGTDASSLNGHGKNPIQLAQSKLKLLRMRPYANSEDTERLKAEIATVVDAMLAYLRARDSETTEIEALRRRLEKVDTKEQVDREISLLLENIEGLSLER